MPRDTHISKLQSYMCVYIYIYTHTHTHIYTHIYVYKHTHTHTHIHKASQVAEWLKNLPACNAGDTRDMGSITGLGRCPEGGGGNPLQYSCLENPMDRGAWRARVHTVTKSWTWQATEHTHTHKFSVSKKCSPKFRCLY